VPFEHVVQRYTLIIIAKCMALFKKKEYYDTNLKVIPILQQMYTSS
jgi:hypothetical protein